MIQLRGITVILLVFLMSCSQQNNNAIAKKYELTKSDAAWKKLLNPASYQVMVERGTERPYQNLYYNNHEKGIYVSAATGQPLFSSDDKYDSRTGWPSFTRPISGSAIAIVSDKTLGITRDEVVEAKTGLHLGHLFDDGPKDKGGLRYCMNSAALKFIKK